MRSKKDSVALFVLFACFLSVGCAHTRDLSATDEYRPWIGKTVRMAWPRSFNVFSPIWGPDFIHWFDGYNGYPIIAKVPEGYPVVIEAVKRTEGRYLMVDVAFTHDRLILSLEHPDQKGKRITVWSELNFVEPFKYKEGYTDDLIAGQKLPHMPII
jgi:hypothetical protein